MQRALAEAVEDQDVDELRAIIPSARASGVDNGIIDSAQRVLDFLEGRDDRGNAAFKKVFSDALENRDAERLKLYLPRASLYQIPTREIAHAEALLDSLENEFPHEISVDSASTESTMEPLESCALVSSPSESDQILSPLSPVSVTNPYVVSERPNKELDEIWFNIADELYDSYASGLQLFLKGMGQISAGAGKDRRRPKTPRVSRKSQSQKLSEAEEANIVTATSCASREPKVGDRVVAKDGKCIIGHLKWKLDSGEQATVERLNGDEYFELRNAKGERSSHVFLREDFVYSMEETHPCLPACMNPSCGIHHAKCPNRGKRIQKGVRYLPMFKDGEPVIVCESGNTFRVVDRNGLAYHLSKNWDDKDEDRGPNFGDEVEGVDEKDGWLMVPIKVRPTVGNLVKIMDTYHTRFNCPLTIGNIYPIVKDEGGVQPYLVEGNDVWLYEADAKLQTVDQAPTERKNRMTCCPSVTQKAHKQASAGELPSQPETPLRKSKSVAALIGKVKATNRSSSTPKSVPVKKMARGRSEGDVSAQHLRSQAVARSRTPRDNRVLRREAQELGARFDEAFRRAGEGIIASVGDCHAGRTCCLLSNNYRANFFGGCIYSWISGKRHIPPLKDVVSLGRSRTSTKSKNLVVVFSYGEIDCRCHSSKFISNVHSLTGPYTLKICDYIKSARPYMPRTTILPIILAVPPPTNQGHNPEAPFRDSLELRINATKKLNISLEAHCQKRGIAFTGADTWEYVEDERGALHKEFSDGHVHIPSTHCGPVLERLREIIGFHF